MKVIQPQSIEGRERDIACPKGGFRSLRYLLKRDGMGFSLHRTEIPVGSPQFWHYKHHLEACYCVSGLGVLTNSLSGEEFTIQAGVLYALDDHDPHTFQALEDVVLISVFNPPVTGTETHGPDGSYAKEEKTTSGKEKSPNGSPQKEISEEKAASQCRSFAIGQDCTNF